MTFYLNNSLMTHPYLSSSPFVGFRPQMTAPGDPGDSVSQATNRWTSLPTAENDGAKEDFYKMFPLVTIHDPFCESV